MTEFLTGLLDTSGFMPRRLCGDAWTEDLVKRIEAGEYVMFDDSPEHFGADRRNQT